MTEEEYFRKNYPDYCYGDRLLSPYWDLFQDGVEFGERQSEKKIEELEQKLEQTEEDLADYQFNYPTIKELTEGTCFAHLKSLEKENAELKKKIGIYQKGMYDEIEKRDKKLSKAKELLNEFMRISVASVEEYEPEFSELIKKTEQFMEKVK